MAGIAILKRLLMKQAMKESAPFQHEGIMSISKALSGNVDAKVKRWIESAKRQGQDIDKMGEQELKYLIEINKPKAPKVYSNEEASGILNRFMNQNKRGEVIKGKFGKPFAEEIVTVERVVTDIKKMKPIDSMKEANKVLRGEGRYKSLSKADREKIVNDESVTDHIFERNIEPDPEDFAQGGRTGLSYLLAEDTNERMPMWLGGGLGAGKALLREMLKYFSKGSKHGKSPTEMLKLVNPKQFNEMLDRPEGIPALAKEMIEKYIKTIKKDRSTTIDEIITSAKHIKKAEDAITSHKQWMIEDMIKKGIDRENAEMFAEGLSKSMAKVGPKDAPKITEQGLLELENIYKNLITKDRPLNAEGGRIGFSKGKGVDLLRRGFLKTMGGVGAGIAALKTGLLKLTGKEGATVAKELTEVPIKDISGMPSWFKPLVNKVIKEGTDVTKQNAYKERMVVHKSKLPESKTDVYVHQDLDSGDVWVDIGMEKHGFPDGKFGQPVRLEYKAGEIIEPDISKTGKVKSQGGKSQEEFWVEEAEFTGGHPENVKFEEVSVNKFGQHESNFDEVEMFATGKKKKTRDISSLQKQDEDLADHFSNYPEPDDFASGGIAKMLGE